MRDRYGKTADIQTIRHTMHQCSKSVPSVFVLLEKTPTVDGQNPAPGQGPVQNGVNYRVQLVQNFDH